MRLHLHIGMPKCGSTTIQEYFGLNREKLAAVGWHYPESVFPLIEGPNTNLPSLLAEGVVELEHVCRPLLDGTATDLLLSSEFFSCSCPASPQKRWRHSDNVSTI